jgi:putative transposase
VAGYYLGFEPPSSLRTTLALRQGIWRKGDPHWEICGIPDILYTDNGSDFRSKHLEQVAADSEDPTHLLDTWTAAGTRAHRALLSHVNDMFLCDLDGYTARRGRKPTLTLDSLEKQFHTFLLEVYHRRPSSEGKLSPKERWEQGGFLAAHAR